MTERLGLAVQSRGAWAIMIALAAVLLCVAPGPAPAQPRAAEAPAAPAAAAVPETQTTLPKLNEMTPPTAESTSASTRN